jgi:RNA polymerase sigma-70 factor, ECF subfamily
LREGTEVRNAWGRISISKRPVGDHQGGDREYKGRDENAVTDAPVLPHRPVVVLPPVGSAPRLAKVRSKRDARLRELVRNHVHMVARVLGNAGTAEADIDDDVQKVFIALSNRLDDVQVGAEKAFLVQTALNIAAHSRRTMARRRETLTGYASEVTDFAARPEEMAECKQMRRMLDQILCAMDADLRAVFVLFELEEMTMLEIASILDLPTGTVASRLRRARSDFRERVAMIEGLPRTEVG